MKVYLAGPMRGIEEYNFPAFHRAAAAIRARGHEVWSPAEKDEEGGFNPKTDTARSLAEYMAEDLPAVCGCDAVAVLPGWQASQGASLEVVVARALGLPILDAATLEPHTETVLAEASRLVDGDRQGTYGPPHEDFARTAAFWTTRFAHKLRDGERFTAEDIPPAMRLVKESRLVQTPRHRDSLTDICGYARTQEKVWEALPE